MALNSIPSCMVNIEGYWAREAFSVKSMREGKRLSMAHSNVDDVIKSDYKFMIYKIRCARHFLMYVN